MDVDRLIQKIITSVSDNTRKAVWERLYQDEKILRPASQLPSYLPEKYRRMCRIASEPDAAFRSEAWIFCRQGQFMADFEEEEGDLRTEFLCYFPTYRQMNPAQLRAYFTWRTRLRRGQYEPVSTSYAFVYIYELLNQIGVADPADGYEKLRQFHLHYGTADPKIAYYLAIWMPDYAVYYGLDPESITETEEERELAAAMSALKNAADCPEETLFSALCRLSSYDIRRSRGYKAHPKETSRLCCAVYRDFAAFCDAHRKRSLFERLFGLQTTLSYPMFRSAVFWEKGNRPDRVVRRSEWDVFTCKNSLWSRTGYFGKPDKNRELGRILKAVDCHLRKVYALPPLTPPDGVSQILTDMIERNAKAIATVKPPVPEMAFDLSLLSRIRQAADETRDSLLVEEPTPDEPWFKAAPAEEAVLSAAENRPTSGGDAPEETAEHDVAAGSTDTVLTAQEQCFLRGLLAGLSASAAGREAGGFPALLADAINEKLYDTFADTVLGSEDGEAVVLPDYREELERMVAQ